MGRSTRIVLAALWMLMWSGIAVFEAHAHESRPLYVEITELQANTYKMQWLIPPTIPNHNTPAIDLPESCKRLGGPLAAGDPESQEGQALYQCKGGLAGETVIVAYPLYNPSVSTLFKYRNAKGEQYTTLLGPQEPAWQVPEAETRSRVARDYTRLGIHHILQGIDHLLFLVCLMWIAGTLRRILTTITGFTLAHSVSLVLSALNVIHVAIMPVHAVIVLSIVFLAAEIARGPGNSLTWRYPITVSSGFGLIHGLGFAAILNEIGLPRTSFLTGLLFFNVGVEIGQILFAALLMALMMSLRKVGIFLPEKARPIPVYAMGSLAAFWFVGRLAAMF